MTRTVSVVIATYNRPEQCKRAIDSVLAQTQPPLEVIVVDDCSTPPFHDDRVRVLRTSQNTKAAFGWASPGYVRTIGLRETRGDYVAFLDDDDYWLPHKLETQLMAMDRSGVGASCSDALCGGGSYNPATQYPRMLADVFLVELRGIFARAHSHAIEAEFPALFSRDLLCIHNLVIASSVVVTRSILEAVGFMKTVPIGQEDYSCWLDVARHTQFAFVSTPTLHYDSSPSNNR